MPSLLPLLCATLIVVAVSAVVPPIARSQQPVNLNVECELCDYLVPVIAHLVEEDEPKIEAKLDVVCRALGNSFGGLCKNFINSHLEKIVKELESGTGADKVCHEVGLCHAKEVVDETKGFTCRLCVELVQQVEKLINENEGEIKAELDKFCSTFGFPTSTACKAVVDLKLKSIIKGLEAGHSPSQICQEIDTCDKAAELVLNANDVQCAMCDLVVPLAQKAIDSGDNQLTGVCKEINLGGQQCDTFLNANGRRIVAELKAKTPLSTVCSRVSICHSDDLLAHAQAALSSPFVSSSYSRRLCRVCEDVCEAVDKALLYGEPAEIKLVNVLCDKLGMFAGLCRDVVDKELPKIVAWLNKKDEPEKVCHFIRLCK